MLLQASSFKLQASITMVSGFFQADDPAVLQAVGSPFQASANPERTGSRQFPDSPCQSSHPLHPFFPGPKARKSVIYLYNLLGITLKLFGASQWIFLVASLLKHKCAALHFVANKYPTKGNADARLFRVRCCHPRLRALPLSPPSRHGPLFTGSRSHDLGGWRNVLEEGCRN